MLSQIVDFVILASALAMAITNLYNFFAKPTAKFKQRRLKQEKEQIQEVLDEELPEILLKRDLETRDKYRLYTKNALVYKYTSNGIKQVKNEYYYKQLKNKKL